MTKPQHLCLLALVSTASGLTSFQRAILHSRQSPQHTFSTALHYRDDAIVDVEVLSHQTVDLVQRCEPATASEPESDICTAIETAISAYREIRIPLDWYPEQTKAAEDADGSTTSCSTYRRKESERSGSSTVKVKILEWKKQPGDIVTQGETMVILQKSHLDFYGRTIDKQRIEVASKEDGILKAALIRQDQELNLSEHNSRSLLALFHPTLFHCIDIDESTRMDAVLLREDETDKEYKKKEMESRQLINQGDEKSTTTPDKYQEENDNQEEVIDEEERLSLPVVPKREKEDSGSQEISNEATPLPTSSNTTIESLEDDENHQLNKEEQSSASSKTIISEEKQLPVPTAPAMKKEDSVSQEISKYSETLPTSSIATLEIPEEDEHQEEDPLPKTALLETNLDEGDRRAETTDCSTKTVLSFQKTKSVFGTYYITDMEASSIMETIDVALDSKRIVDSAATAVINQLSDNSRNERIDCNTETILKDDTTKSSIGTHLTIDVEPSSSMDTTDVVLDSESIVDLAAKVVANQLFNDLHSTMSKTTKSKVDASPSNVKLHKNATAKKLESKLNESIQVIHAPQINTSVNDNGTVPRPNEKPWGSQKSEVFTVIVDFFTEKFQKT